jgi:hypothetical protein
LRRLGFSLFALCFLAWLASPVRADDLTTLRIEIKDDDGRPVDRASVIVRFVKGRSYLKLGKKNVKSWQLKTNQEGVAKVPPIPQGDILVQVIAKNYQTFGQVFEVEEPRKTIEITLNPPQKPYSVHGDNDPTGKTGEDPDGN